MQDPSEHCGDDGVGVPFPKPDTKQRACDYEDERGFAE